MFSDFFISDQNRHSVFQTKAVNIEIFCKAKPCRRLNLTIRSRENRGKLGRVEHGLFAVL